MTFTNSQSTFRGGSSNQTKGPVRVLVVDDSAFVRSIITRKINAEPDLEVVGQAKDGLEAVEQVKTLRPDVVTMDVTMPRLDGLGAVKRIMAEQPTPIVMLSALTGPGADVTMQALELGAIDFFLKVSVASPTGSDDGITQLAKKLRVAAGARVTAGRSTPPRSSVSKTPVGGDFNTLVVIGSSTGGPKALAQVIPKLPGDLNAAVLIVQHMPPHFTASLSARLDSASELEVAEASDGDRLKRGRVLMAPGGFHMTLQGNGRIVLDTGPEVHGVRPSVDVTMLSAVQTFRGKCHGVILTGMGSDGRDGCGAIKAAGGSVVAEDESTCAVYGMPKSVVDAGYADRVKPIDAVAHEIVRICGVLSTTGAAQARSGAR
ncbi:MAG: chemotaxis response regulator protein-glutamate methylesterase [Chloroflexi bacterium]|nr:chemotaxis response regulator protein-glutamate methylesterase [Chloroflexota bacterium]